MHISRLCRSLLPYRHRNGRSVLAVLDFLEYWRKEIWSLYWTMIFPGSVPKLIGTMLVLVHQATRLSAYSTCDTCARARDTSERTIDMQLTRHVNIHMCEHEYAGLFILHT